MPFRSQAQARKLAVLTGQGKVSFKAFKEWANATKDLSKLPERLKKKKK